MFIGEWFTGGDVKGALLTCDFATDGSRKDTADVAAKSSDPF